MGTEHVTNKHLYIQKPFKRLRRSAGPPKVT
jgi:hypothetical protein